MPLAFLILGALIIVTAYQGTYKDFGNQLVQDFSGSGSFIYWVAAVAIVGMLGYVKVFKTPSRLFLVLIIIAFFLSDKGNVFGKLATAFKNIQPDQNRITEPAAPGNPTINIAGAGSGGLGGLLGGVSKLFSASNPATAATSATATGGLT